MNIIELIKKKYSRNTLLKSILLVAGGTLSAQVIKIVISPLLTRIYSPEEMGILTTYISVLSIFTVMSTISYEYTIPINKDEKTALNSVVSSFIILMSFTLGMSAIIIFFGDEIIPVFNLEPIMRYIYFIPIGVFLNGQYKISLQWAFRNKDYRSISRTKMIQGLSSNSGKVLLGLFSFSTIGLIISEIIGQSLGVRMLFQDLLKRRASLKSFISYKEIKYILKRYFKFCTMNTAGMMFNNLGIQLPIVFIGSIYGIQVVGFYGLANSILNLPISLVGKSVGDVFYSEASNGGNPNPLEIKKMSREILRKLVLIGIVPMIIVILFGPYLFSVIFGDVWSVAGEYARLLTIVIFARLVFTPISKIFQIFQRQNEYLRLNVLRIITVSILFVIAKHFSLTEYTTILIYSIAMSIIYLITFITAQKILDHEIRNEAS
jgi:O-antigen/teichoic acid export membrane protein